MHEVIHLAVGLSIYFFEGITYLSFVTYLIFAICYVLLICDLQNFYLPFYLNIAITLIAFTSAYFDILFISNGFSLNISNISLSIVGFITGYFFLWFINLFYLLLKNKHGIGGGDFILLGGIGSITGPLSLSTIILIGSIGTLTIMLINQKKYSKELPLGAGLILGLFIYEFFKYFELFPYQYVI
jgi:leader peptidase (prepilin peptidase)/N-methyltransferase